MARWPKYCLIALVLLALILSLAVAYRRYQVEAANRTVQLAVDYQEVVRVSEYTGLGLKEVLVRLKDGGVGAVLVKEPRISDLEEGLSWGKEPVWVKSGAEVVATQSLPGPVAGAVKPRYTYLVTRDRELARELAWQLELKLPGAPVQALEGGNLYLVGTPFSRFDLKQQEFGLGFGGFPWEAVAEVGLKVIPQIKPWPASEPQAVEAALGALKPYREHISLLLFDGDRLPGYPGLIPALAAAVRELDVPVGLIEFSAQKGLPSLARLNGKQAVRLHSLRAEEIKEDMSPAKVVDRFLLAAGERNIRVLVARFFFPGKANVTPTNVLDYNLAYLKQVRDGLLAQGFILGQAQPFTPFPLPRTYFLFIGLGVWAAAVLLLTALGLSRGVIWSLAVLGLLGFLFLLKVDFLLARQTAALVAAVVFPLLGILAHRREKPATLPAATLLFLRTTAVSLAGAVLVVGLLGDIGFMLRLDQFLGTKVAHLAPPVLLWVVLWALPQGREGLRRWLASPVTWLYLLALALAVVVGYVYLVRTGNEGAAFAPAWEREIRRFLDVTLQVRPRTKEFLLGHPFLVLSYYLGYRSRRLVLWLVGSIGQASIINTFAHVHTPLAVSLLRTANGIWLGLGLGLILVFVYRLLNGRIGRKPLEDGSCVP